jgi:hypothetical protein
LEKVPGVYFCFRRDKPRIVVIGERRGGRGREAAVTELENLDGWLLNFFQGEGGPLLELDAW